MEKKVEVLCEEQMQWQLSLLKATHQEFHQIFYEDIRLPIYSNYPNSKFIKKMIDLGLPKSLGAITLNVPSESMKDFCKLFTKPFISQVEVGNIIGNLKTVNVQNKFLPLLSRFSSMVTKRITFSMFNINEKQLKRIFSAARRTPSIEFDSCTMVFTSSSDFTRCFTRTKIQKLSFICCGPASDKRWCYFPEQFEYLICGLSTEDLQNSLQTLVVKGSEFDKAYPLRVLLKYKFDSTNFEGDFYYSLSDSDEGLPISDDSEY
ncbi:unnamed protein product [Moneuplotes crassus]|uniref:Uncharacterized protein n=1 Tax=Euplotes crassus TaxID=5936 RepID=A0AAD1Y9L6_EUPCR|nr:unnamed protein product [Moneuplotes crassus]